MVAQKLVFDILCRALLENDITKEDDGIEMEILPGFKGKVGNFDFNGTMTITIKINGGRKIEEEE